MAYNGQYAARQGSYDQSYNQGQPSFSNQPLPGGQVPYHSNQSYDPYADPYNSHQPPHQTYDQGVGYESGGYKDDPLPAPPSQDSGVASTKEFGGGYGNEVFESPTKKERTVKSLRAYRYDHQGNLWTKGSRLQCFGRFFCCTILIFVFLLVSILLNLALWIRPPDIGINDVAPVTSGSTIQLQNDGLTINLGVSISVDNPNYFSVDFRKIEAEIFYPINNTPIGGGTQNNINFNSHTETNFTFPFSIVYKQSLDPGNQILTDLATRCGFLGSPKTQIKVNYKITLGLRILFVVVSPVVSNSFNFDCPLSQQDVSGLLSQAGLTVSSVAGGGGGQ